MNENKTHVFSTKAKIHSNQWWKDRDEYLKQISYLQHSDPHLYWTLLSIVDDVDYNEKRAQCLASAEPLVKHFEFSYKPSRVERPDKCNHIEDVKFAKYR